VQEELPQYIKYVFSTSIESSTDIAYVSLSDVDDSRSLLCCNGAAWYVDDLDDADLCWARPIFLKCRSAQSA
jgi:hypothetical protein